MNTGKFIAVDVYNAGVIGGSTPSLAQLSMYDAVLVSSNYPLHNPLEMGNVLADYIDAGGGVVNSLFSMNLDWGLDPTSRFITSNYNLIAPDIVNYTFTPLNLVKTIPTHPILNQVNTFNGGLVSYTIASPSVQLGSLVVASWDNNWPLVVVKNNIGPRQVERVDLNFYPMSTSTVSSNGWDATTDGAMLIANSLLYVSNGLTPFFGNPGPISLCAEGSYYLNPTTTEGTWESTNPLVATISPNGYITGLSAGTSIISLTNQVGTVSTTVTVASIPALPITDGRSAYKFNGNPQGPTLSGSTINYVGYDGYTYYSQTQPTQVGFYRANIQSGNEAGCPNRFYIFTCTTCNN
jgi:hypothetical protein